MNEEEAIPKYALRFRPRAVRDLDIESVRLAEIAGDAVALDWLARIREEITTLATMPRRFPLAPEEDLIERSVRVILFRRTPGGPAWRVVLHRRREPGGYPRGANKACSARLLSFECP